MYYFIVVNLLILQLMFSTVKGNNFELLNYTLKDRRRVISTSLFDRVEFPADGVIPMLNRKVFKGTRVSIREHPYVASIRRNVAHYLTGTILTRNVVLTVAYPLIDVSIAELSVVVGENYADRGSKLLTVVLMILHQDFDQYTLRNNIAILRTFEDITYKGSAKSIPLFRASESIYGHKAFVTGWGRCDRTGKELCLPRSTRYTPGENLDPMLRTVTFNIDDKNFDYCLRYQFNDVPLPPGMLCLGIAREQNYVTQCLAVPGAPLVVEARLAALLSYGFGCCHYKDLPLVYTSTQYYNPWLEHNIRILRSIHKMFLLKLFQAKRAYVLKEWLGLTRVVPPDPYTDFDKHMSMLRVDRDLARLLGNVYDIRDYLYNGTLHKYKTKLYTKLREMLATDGGDEKKDKDNELCFENRQLNMSVTSVVKEKMDEINFDSSLTDTDNDLEEDDSNEDFVV